jgi:hypothetical protein
MSVYQWSDFPTLAGQHFFESSSPAAQAARTRDLLYCFSELLLRCRHSRHLQAVYRDEKE